ncbi:hypothetical protein BKA70DRAFT_159239 [Coprinopsis sp. MPI-PUGE-AT-0042]|nr:hypothetical protein BKA70DRAFT_159239 [Coprinopsis sp. MPI-PUGE-AT-0042]
MYSPHQLSPYLSSNTPIPHHLEPILETYLSQTASFIAELDAEIDQLQSALDAKRRRRDQYKKGYEEHFQLQSSIRSIPPEIWGVIFGFTLGDEPFGQWEYRTYGNLREVCKVWRDVAAETPDICRGLTFHLDEPLGQASYSDEKGIKHAKDKLEPWLRLVSRNHPYHLVLGTDDIVLVDWPQSRWTEDDATEIVRWILSTAPTPTLLSVTNSGVFSLVYTNAPRDNQISHLSLIFGQDMVVRTVERIPFQEVFPSLKSLFSNTPLEFYSTMGHSTLQSLILNRFYGSAWDFLIFLTGFPSLRELRLGAGEPYDPEEDPSSPPMPLIHPTLKMLVVNGEDLLLGFEHITFPSLEFLCLKTSIWSRQPYDLLANVLPAFLQRCSLDNNNFSVSIIGEPFKFVFDLFIYNLPRGTRLHLDVDVQMDKDVDMQKVRLIPGAPNQACRFAEVFCTRRPKDLDWLHHHSHSPGSELVKLYVPGGILEEDEIEVVREEVVYWGHALEVLEMDAFTKLLRSSIPQMPLDCDMEDLAWKIWRGSSFIGSIS